MKTIKTRENVEKGIKTFNKTVAWTERVKDPVVYLNKKTKETTGDSSPTEYGEDKIKYYSNRAKDEVIYSFKKAAIKSKENLINKYKKSKLSKKENNTIIKTKDSINHTIKDVKSINKTKKIKETQKNMERAKQLAIKTKRVAEQTTKATVKTTKVVVKAIVSAIKAMIEGLSSLIGLLASGGVVALIVVVVICLIALLCSSVFGIFFANESQSITMQQVVRNVNAELYKKMETEKLFSKTDDVTINYSNNNWREVIAIYSVRYSEDPSNAEPILYLNESNVNRLKNIFWDMNKYTAMTKMVQKEEVFKDSSGREFPRTVMKQVLEINVTQESKENIMRRYGFTEEQKNQVNELLSNKYNDLWISLLYGNSSNTAIVNVALQEVGYTHGDKFWKWYGYDERVEWCAVFVSWAANEVGLLNTTIPKFSGVGDGIDWFKSRGQWENKNYIPRPGDIIFFDWENDGKANHVGIVDHVENDMIYTVEGNSTDDGVRQKIYFMNSPVIYGFGVPNYN